MNAIMGMTEIAKRKATDPQQARQLATVTTAANKLLGVINDILDISKIEAERLVLEHIEFTLEDVLKSHTNITWHEAREKGLALVTEIAPQLARRKLQGDPVRLGQVLRNLTGNAIKFTESGSVAVRIAVVEDLPAALVLRFEVTDSGIGITADDQKRLFAAFEQADGSMTRKYGGTGLGLAISKRLVEAMDGRIGGVSSPGEGSTFWFTARLATSARGHDSASENSSAMPGADAEKS
jgi:signal transduction histidine kinase